MVICDEIPKRRYYGFAKVVYVLIYIMPRITNHAFSCDTCIFYFIKTPCLVKFNLRHHQFIVDVSVLIIFVTTVYYQSDGSSSSSSTSGFLPL